MNRLKTTFRSLRYKNFRLFFPGLITSQVGIWIQNVAISWVVYSLTKSPFMMGGILFVNTLPLFLVTPFAGMVIDKFDRHRLLMIIQILFALQAFLMAFCAMSNHLTIWNIIVLGCISRCFDFCCRHCVVFYHKFFMHTAVCISCYDDGF